ncbi:Arginine permease CAN1 [Paramyrothecium foliicola]|nr:Arginine permease CAN1 [Paramyrothecium foliicola]
MASSSYVTFRDGIYQDISEKLKRRTDGSQKFAPKGLVRGVLNTQTLRRLYQILTEEGQQQLPITESEFIDRIDQRKLRRFIAILVYAICPIEAMWKFASQLVAPSVWPLVSTRGSELGALPASNEDLQLIFRDTVIKDKFYETQFIFCTVVILRGEEVIVKHPTLERLPYLEEPEEIGSGSFGKVYKVYVAKRHIVNQADETENREPKQLARKDYILDDTTDTHAKKEREIWNTLLRTPTGVCKNILQSLGSVQIGKTYSLFMELAESDLRSYMMERFSIPPTTMNNKAELVRCAAGLAGGLNFLHTQLKLEDGTEVVCYHMDLKPDNILVFPDIDRGPGFKIWKLSDFGMARVKTKQSRKLGDREKDFNSLFKRRNQTSDPTASATVNNRGEGTYLAPESVSRKAKMKASSDVWALGCIISVLFTYMEYGKEGLTLYSEKRASRSRSESCDDRDRFFLYSSRLTSIKRHPATSEWHKQLIKQAEGRNKHESQIIADMLRYVDKYILVIEQTRRESALNVQKELERSYQLYRKVEGLQADEADLDNIGAITRSSRPWQGLLNKLHREVDESASHHWRITTTSRTGFKGCRIAPSGKLAAFWTETKIVLFTSSSLSASRGEATNGAEHILEPDEGLWNSVDLTDRYLVASTARKGSNFQGSDGGSNAVPFFTSLAVFHGEKTCVLVTREKLVHVISAKDNDTERDIQEKVANYRVLRLMIDRKNSRLFAIAATSVSNKLLLAEMNVPSPGKKISFKEISKIPGLAYGDSFAARQAEPLELADLVDEHSPQTGSDNDHVNHSIKQITKIIQVRPNPDRMVHRKLRGIHLFMITLNATLGAGLYWRGGHALEVGGLISLVLSFLLVGALAWAVMQCIAEMLCLWPVPGALSVYVRTFVDDELGIAMGVAYWFTYSVSFAALLVVVAEEVGLWTDKNEGIISGVVIYFATPVILVGINSIEVGHILKIYGWIEVLFGTIKLVLLAVVILTLSVIIARDGIDSNILHSNEPREFDRSVASNWPTAFFISTSVAIYAYIGVEIIAASALEARGAKRQQIRTTSTPLNGWAAKVKCSNGDMSALPSSIFVIIAEESGIPGLGHIFNGIIVFAALTCASTNLYVASRSLFGLTARLEGGSRQSLYLRLLAQFGKTNKNRVPIRAVIASALAFCWVPFIQYFGNQRSIEFIEVLGQMGSVGVITVWACNCLAYIRFHHGMREHYEALERQAIPRADRDGDDYPYRIVSNGSLLWDGFQTEAFLSAFLFVSLRLFKLLIT